MSWLSKAWNAVTGTVKAIISNPVTAIAAIGLAIYAPALGLRMLGSMMVSNVLNAVTAKDDGASNNPDNSSTSQPGNTQMIGAKTTNKLPAVYGKAFMAPILVDAKISTDNQTMWYVGALCEAPTAGTATVTFGKVLWDGSTVTFGSDGRVTKLTNPAGQEDTKIDGNLFIYFYNGSATPINGTTQTAYQVLQDSTIPAAARWTGNEKMNNTIFVIIKLVYSTDDAVTGLPGSIQFETNIYQNGITDGYKPGSAMLDYLTNDRFGAGLESSDINLQSFYDLDTYSDQVITYTPVGTEGSTKPRYRFNGMIDTTASVMSNWMAMAECSDSYIQYNESLGKWSVIANKGYDQLPNSKVIGELFLLDGNNIIGGINITPLDLNSTPNSVESNFFNYKTNGQNDSVYAETPQRLQNFYEPPQRLTTTYRFVDDYIRAQYLSNRKLEQCRADFIVDLTADYSAIQVDAGDVVLLTYEPFGGTGLSWTNKPFRVIQVQEARGDDGTLTCKLQLSEYSSQVYDNFTIQDYTPDLSNYVLDPALLNKPDTPTIPTATILPVDSVPSFVVAAKTPSSGVTVAMEFWYGPTDAITDNNYKLWETQYNSSKAQYGVSIDESVKVTGLPEGTWYWRVRAIGTMRKSEFSDSVSIVWEPVIAESNVGDAKGNAQKSTAQVVPFEDNTSWPNNTRGIRPSGGVTVVASGNPGSIQVGFSSSVYANDGLDTSDDRPSVFNCLEVWKNRSRKEYYHKVLSIRQVFNGTDDDNFATNRLQALGTSGVDLISDDGGVTWSTYSSSSTTSTQADGISAFTGTSVDRRYQTVTVGPAEVSSYTATVSSNYGYRDFTAAEPWPIRFIFDVASNILTTVNAIAQAPGSGTAYRPSMDDTYRDTVTSLVVGDNGVIATNRASSNAFGSSNVPYPPYRSVYDGQNGSFSKETTNGTLQNLYDVFCNTYDNVTNKSYTAIAVGGAGTILKSNRNNVLDVNAQTAKFTWTGKSVYDFDGTTPLYQHLYAVAGDNTGPTGTSVWVAVGATGVIISSVDNGETWTRRECFQSDGVTQLASPLRSVRYGNGKWIVCGDDGIIYSSTDTITWTLLTPTIRPAYAVEWPRNLYCVEWSSALGRFSIGGDNIILNSSDTTIAFNDTYTESADESYSLSRLWYRGSNAVVATKTKVDKANRLINGQTVSSTIIDTDYKKGDEIQYLLVIGNMNSHLVYADAPVITATEYKK